MHLMTPSVSFSDLGVERCLVHALDDKGITEPFEVQREAIPDGMLGRDVCCRAPTGSGKTLAFGLPLLTRCRRARPNLPTSLILTPTRELAVQIYSVLTPLASEVNLDVLAIYGGASYGKQIRALKRGVDIVVAAFTAITARHAVDVDTCQVARKLEIWIETITRGMLN